MNYDDPEAEENRLDQSLRDKFADFELTPGAPVWASIENRISHLPAPAKRRRWLPIPLLFFLTALVSGLGGWLLPHRATTTASRSATTNVLPLASTLKQTNTLAGALRNADRRFSSRGNSTVTKAIDHAPSQQGVTDYSITPGIAFQPHVTATHSASNPRFLAANTRPAIVLPVSSKGNNLPILIPALAPPDGATNSSAIAPAAPDKNPGLGEAKPTLATGIPSAVAIDSIPVTLRPLVALERQTLVQLPAIPASRPEAVAALQAERIELLRLQHRTDSLLLALGEILPAAPMALATTPDTTQAETKIPQPEIRKWSLLLFAAPEQNYLKYNAAANDELSNLRRNQETGRAGVNAALTAEYQATKHLSFGLGLGYSTYGAELRQAVRNTTYKVTYDTTVTTTNTDYNTTSSTYSIRVVQLAQLSPVFNASGQVLHYDTVYVPRNDTLRATILSHDAVHGTTKVVTPLLHPVTTTTYKTYRPDYHFLTLPLLVRYRFALAPGTRWWADVSGGAQLQFFLGGTQLVSDNDGQTFRTETVRAGEGPFRPLNVALNAALALNYALTPRLSLSIGPSLRWQAMSVFKPETGIRQQPTATGLQFGVRWKL